MSHSFRATWKVVIIYVALFWIVTRVYFPSLFQDVYKRQGLRRKPLADLLEELKDYDITVTSFDFFEALPLNEYPQHFKPVADYRDWLAQAKSANSDDLFVVTGSLYFISELRNYLINE